MDVSRTAQGYGRNKLHRVGGTRYEDYPVMGRRSRQKMGALSLPPKAGTIPRDRSTFVFQDSY